MEYKFFAQEKDNWCVPACLQSILDRRGFSVLPQKFIYSLLETNKNGVILNNKNLNHFLNFYGLKSEYFHDKTSFLEIDFLLKETLESNRDILAGYYFNSSNKHASLLKRINLDEIILHDPNRKIKKIHLITLLSLMPLDHQCGFYVISHDLGQVSHSSGYSKFFQSIPISSNRFSG